jgi:hypothetical protein
MPTLPGEKVSGKETGTPYFRFTGIITSAGTCEIEPGFTSSNVIQLPRNGLPTVVRAMTRRWEITWEILCRDSA